MLLHLPSPLTLSAVQLDREALDRGALGSAALVRVEAEPAQRGVPADGAADGVHRQGACEEPRGVRVRLGCRLGRVIERHWGGITGGARRAEHERRGGVEEDRCGLGEHERAVLGEELVQT